MNKSSTSRSSSTSLRASSTSQRSKPSSPSGKSKPASSKPLSSKPLSSKLNRKAMPNVTKVASKSPSKRSKAPPAETHTQSSSVASSSTTASPTALSLTTSPPPSPTPTARTIRTTHTLASSQTIATTTSSLHSKLVTLTLDLEDASSTVTLLAAAMTKVSAKGERMQHDVGERYRKVFKEQTESAKEELSGKLEVADRLTGEKRELATQVQALQVCIGEAEGRIKKGVETVLKEGEVEREEQAACWGEGEAVRREKWLERKTMEIREVTIKGLEPEVARIIEMHKGEVERMEGEFKERKREWLRKHYDTVEENKVQIGEKAMRKYDTIIKVTREAGNDRLTDVHSSHADNLVRLRLKLQDESDALRRWQQGELKRIAEAHADECASVRVTEGKRLEEVRRRQKEEVEAGERGAQSALEALENDSMSVREVWENKIRNKIVKESLDVLEKEREELKARRDGEIEKAIRKGQMGFADLRSREACNVKELQEAAKAEFDLRIKGIMDKKNRWVEKLAENVDLTRELVDEKGRHGKTLIALEDYMGKLDGDIEDALRGREEHKALLVTEEERVGERKGRDLKVLMMDRVAAEKGVGEVRRELEGRMLRGKDAIRVCKSEHEKDLEALERRVKVEVGDISGQIREVEEVISGQMVRCEHAKKMIESYRGRRKAGAEKDKKLRAF